jgi:hypothetical protein
LTNNLADGGSCAAKVDLRNGKHAVTVSSNTMQLKSEMLIRQVIEVLTLLPHKRRISRSDSGWGNANQEVIQSVEDGKPLYAYR